MQALGVRIELGVELMLADLGGAAPDGDALELASHPLEVAAFVLRSGGTEAAAAAALVHEVVERAPHPGDALAELQITVGTRVREIVTAVTGVEPDRVAGWRERKQRALDWVRATVRDLEADHDALRVALADALSHAHTLEAQLADPAIGAKAFDRCRDAGEDLDARRDAVLGWLGDTSRALALGVDLPGAMKSQVRELQRAYSAIAGRTHSLGPTRMR